MPLYEHVFIARQDISSAQVDTLVQDFTGILETGGGKVTKTESWGLRNLTYRIKKNRKGHYVLLNIDAPSDAVLELERQERIHDDVLRYLTLRVEEHEEGPSAIIQGRKERGGRDDEDGDGRRPRRDRDDRGDRGDRGERRDRDDRGSREAAPAQTQESE